MRFLNRSAGRVSRLRRRPLASAILLLLGLVLTGTLYSAFSPASAEQSQDQQALVDQGHKLFLVGCSFCHGEHGQGVLTTDGHNLGPTVIGVGAASVDFQVGTGRMPLAQSGAQDAPKTVVYTPDEINALAAYVASLGPGPAVPDSSDYSLAGLSPQERQQAVVQGGQIFLTNCTACHNFAGKGGALSHGVAAPNLSGTSSRYIFEALLSGPGQMPTFSNGNLSPDEKRDVIAYLDSLRTQPSYGGFGLGGLGPVVEGIFAWLFGLGALIGMAVWIAAHSARSSKRKREVTTT